MGVLLGVGYGCLEATCLIVAHQLRAFFADWTRFSVAVALVGLCVVLGPHDGTALVFWAGVAIVPWRFVHRGSWERCVGRWARPAWRRYWVYDHHWRDLMEQVGFIRVRRFRRDVVPRVVSLRTTHPSGFPQSSSDTLVVRTERPSSEFAKAADDFAHVLGARSCRAYQHPRVRGLVRKHSAVRLVLGFGPDPLERTVPAFLVPASSADVDLRAVPVGLTEDGEVWTLPVLGEQILVAGVNGSGKGSLLHSLVRGLGPMIRDGSVRLWGWDPKGGVELNTSRDLFYRYCDSDDMQDHADMLSDAVTAMQDQLAWVKSQELRKLEHPTPEHPLNVLIIDEMAQITAKQVSTDLTKQIDSALRKLVNMSRASGFPMLGLLQNPTNETNRHRDEFSCFVALELHGGHVRVDMVLGPGMYQLGARCDRIEHVTMAGVGYVVQSGVPEPVRVRCSWVSDEDIRALARDYAPLLPAQSD